MFCKTSSALVAALVLFQNLALAQYEAGPVRLPETSVPDAGTTDGTSAPFPGSLAERQGAVETPPPYAVAGESNEGNSQFVAADQTPSTPVEQRLLTMEKELQDIHAAQDAQKNKYPSAVTIMGVFQADAVGFSQDTASRASYGDIQNGADFRRARLGAKGSVTNNMNYFFQMDFAFFGRPTFTDVWVEWTDLPFLGTVRAGQWKQPFSLEVVSSFRYTTFMERSSMFQAFDPFRHIGIGFYNHSEDLMTTWAASMFRTGRQGYR